MLSARCRVSQVRVVHTARAIARLAKSGQRGCYVKSRRRSTAQGGCLRTLQPHMRAVQCMHNQSIGHRASLDAALVCLRLRSPRTVFCGSGNLLNSSLPQLALGRQLEGQGCSCKRLVRPPRARRRVHLVRGAMAGLSRDQELVGEQPANLLLVSITLLFPGLTTNTAVKSRRQCLLMVKDHRPGECMSKHQPKEMSCWGLPCCTACLGSVSPCLNRRRNSGVLRRLQ